MSSVQDEMLELVLNRYLIYGLICLSGLFVARELRRILKRRSQMRKELFNIDPQAFFNLKVEKSKSKSD
jgi:hypothetical protein